MDRTTTPTRSSTTAIRSAAALSYSEIGTAAVSGSRTVTGRASLGFNFHVGSQVIHFTVKLYLRAPPFTLPVPSHTLMPRRIVCV